MTQIQKEDVSRSGGIREMAPSKKKMSASANVIARRYMGDGSKLKRDAAKIDFFCSLLQGTNVCFGGILKTCPLNDGLSTCLLNDGLSNKRGVTYYVSGSEWGPYLLFYLANFVIEHVEKK
jgi:hypothetical protein